MNKDLLREEGFYTVEGKKYGDIKDFSIYCGINKYYLNWENVHYNCSVGHRRSIIANTSYAVDISCRSFTEEGESYLIDTFIYNYDRSMSKRVIAIDIYNVPVIICIHDPSKLYGIIDKEDIPNMSTHIIDISLIDNIDFKPYNLYIVKI